MMKTILFAAAFMTFAFVTMGATSPAYAHCGTCVKKTGGAKEPCKGEMKKHKPCMKKMGKDKPCMKSKSEKPCAKKKASGEPCYKDGKRGFQMKKRSDIFFNE